MKFQFLLFAMAGLMSAACGGNNSQSSERVADEVVSPFGEGVDSIIVDISTKVDGQRSLILSDNANAVARFENKPDSTLSASMTEELVLLADSLFVEKTSEIILSQEDAEGRTDYPIFTVTLYKGDKGETTRYDMGTQEGNITHCTTCDIRYSAEFRNFLSLVFEVLN